MERRLNNLTAEEALALSVVPREEWEFELTWLAGNDSFVNDEERVNSYKKAKEIYFKEQRQNERKEN